MVTPILPPDFKEFLKLLHAHDVDYLLIGGYAVAYHGYPRATGDMDIWIPTTEETAMRMAAVLREFGFDTFDATPALFLGDKVIVRMGMPPFRIEVSNFIHGVDFSSCLERGIETEIDGIHVRIISLEDLKSNKRASGRPKDLDDLENLP